MADPNRTTVDVLALHHAVTPLWTDKSKAWIAQWFSDNGFARAYGSNPANWSGLINPFTGGRSYSQTHAVGQRVDETTPDATDAERRAGYRVFFIVADPFGQITWHAGSWPYNCRSIAIENLGDYRNYPLRDGDCKVIADFWRAHDQSLGGRTAVYGHLEISELGTACPARIMEGRDTVVNYINNPPQAPQPPTPAPVVEVGREVYEPLKRFKFIPSMQLQNIPDGSSAGGKVFVPGEEIDIRQKLTFSNGAEFYRTKYSSDNEVAKGFPESALEEVAHVPVITTSEEVIATVIPFTTETQEDNTKETDEITQAGVNGKRTVVYLITYTDGVETAREIKSDTVVDPVAQITVLGTYVKPDPIPPQPPLPAHRWIAKLIAWVLNRLKELKEFLNNQKGKK